MATEIETLQKELAATRKVGLDQDQRRPSG
jgi:hypothetical protein